MANTNINTSSLTALITEFRRLQAKDSITPEALGSILQRIADLLATAGTSETQQALNDWYNAMRTAAMYISEIKQSNISDRNDLYLTVEKVSPMGDTTSSSNVGLKLPQATTEHSGVMRAQQVTDLNTLRNRYSDTVLPALERLEASIASLLGNSNDLGALSAKGQIAIEIVNGELRVYGGGQLAQAGYVPYLFRNTRKRNRDKIHTDGADATYGPVSKGWHLFGSRKSVKVEGTVAKFSTNLSKEFHEDAHGYTTDPEALVHPCTHPNGHVTLPWGRSSIRLYDYRAHQNRMVRLRFAIGYAKPVDHGRGKVNVLNLVSNLAEFSVVYNPRANTFSLSR